MAEEVKIADTIIPPGDYTLLKMKVGKLPSGNLINISAHVYRAKHEGPRVLLLAGVHGDEINGVETLRRFIANGTFVDLNKGMVIVIPVLNIFGFINFSREVPDGKDVNRSFPGIKTGSLASRVAFTLTHYIIPNIDIAIDLHTGGASRYNHPQIRYSKKDSLAYELAHYFAPPIVLQKVQLSNSFRKLANQMKVSVMVYEAGEAERFDGFCIELASNGIIRVLHHLGLLGSSITSPHKSVHVTSSGWVRASDAGLFIWSKKAGQKIIKGEPLGEILSPQGDRTRTVLAKRDGIIIGHNNASVVNVGDALFNIGYDPTDL